jgi:hypothetical protein
MTRSFHFPSALPVSWVSSFVYGAVLLLPATVVAQTLPAGVINAPPTTVGANQSIGSNTTLNILPGGTVGRNFTAGGPGAVATDTKVNVAGGTLGEAFSAYTGYAGSELNVTGGVVRGSVDLREGAQARVSGGKMTDRFSVRSDSIAEFSGGTVGVGGRGLSVTAGGVANISGGQFVGDVTAYSQGQLNITGGSFVSAFVAREGSHVRFSGGEFFLNGSPIGDLPVTIIDRAKPELITGTLEDGSVVLFSPAQTSFNTGGDELHGVAFQHTYVPPIDLAPITVSDNSTIQGLRQGQTLTLNHGGSLPDRVVAVGATLNIAGGYAGNGFQVANTTVNVTGGTLGTSTSSSGYGEEFRAFGDSVLNLSGGQVNNWLYAYRGSTVNLSGPVIMGAPVFFEPGSTANVSSGEFEDYVVARGAAVNISGGHFNQTFTVADGGQVSMTGGQVGGSTLVQSGAHFHLAGGVVGQGMRNAPGSSPAFREGNVTIAGGEFRLNNTPIAAASVSLLEFDDVLTGTLTDGTPFVFSGFSADILYDVQLVRTTLPAIDVTPLSIDSAVAPTGLREGQSLTLLPGGELPNDFAVVGSTLALKGDSIARGLEVVRSHIDISSGSGGYNLSIFDGSVVNVTGGDIDGFVDVNSGGTLNVSGGQFGRLLYVRSEAVLNLRGGALGDQLIATSGGVVNMTGGKIGDDASLHGGSVINLSGGQLGKSFSARAGSLMNLVGSEFFFNGNLIDLPANGVPVEVLSRDGTLSGTLADGTSFSWLLDGQDPSGLNFAPGAIITIAIGIPEPTTAALLGLALSGFLVANRHRPAAYH